jgi:hypothetical protein
MQLRSLRMSDLRRQSDGCSKLGGELQARFVERYMLAAKIRVLLVSKTAHLVGFPLSSSQPLLSTSGPSHIPINDQPHPRDLRISSDHSKLNLKTFSSSNSRPIPCQAAPWPVNTKAIPGPCPDERTGLEHELLMLLMSSPWMTVYDFQGSLLRFELNVYARSSRYCEFRLWLSLT